MLLHECMLMNNVEFSLQLVKVEELPSTEQTEAAY